MPAAANPSKRDFYVYTFHVEGYPFYVGIGRDQRGPDRLRYVRSLTRAKLRRESLSVRVMAALDKKVRIQYSSTRKPMNRAQALALELKTINRLLRKGYELTNFQHNPHYQDDTSKTVKAVLRRRIRSVVKFQ